MEHVPSASAIIFYVAFSGFGNFTYSSPLLLQQQTQPIIRQQSNGDNPSKTKIKMIKSFVTPSMTMKMINSTSSVVFF